MLKSSFKNVADLFLIIFKHIPISLLSYFVCLNTLPLPLNFHLFIKNIYIINLCILCRTIKKNHNEL